MDEIDDDRNVAANEKRANPDRRRFMQGAAGLLGAMAVASPTSRAGLAQQPAAPTQNQPGPRQRRSRVPALDLRNPVSYAGVASATRVLMDHFKALSERDIKGVADTLHFPYGTFEQTDAVVVKTADDFLGAPPASVNMTTNPERFTDHDGYITEGSYDVFGGLEVFNSDPIQVNLALTYDRYSARGNRLLQCQGVYCITNNDGRWGIQVMSTIFTPGPMVGMKFPESVMTAHRLRETHTLAYQRAYLPDVWAKTRQLGVNLGVIAAKDDDFGFAKAPERRNGIKNRLQVVNYTQERLDAIKIDFPLARNRWKSLGLGNWGFDWGGGPPARLIHQSVDKVHMYDGTTRFTAGGEYISNTEEIDVITLVKDRWGIAGILGYILNHDRSNDVKNVDRGATT
jgi:hypothetical protein